MSNQFILDMVKNVERWMKSKIEKGGCIQYAPVWYINNKHTKQVDIDEEKAPYIKEIFRLRVKWASYNEIAKIINNKGFTWKWWKKITKTWVESIIKNPFYIWFQKFQWELYKSVHQKLISTKVWDKVNWVKRGYTYKDTENEYPLKGIVKSYHTKKPLLALTKKSKYVYYSTNSKEEFIINMNQTHIINAFDEIIHYYVHLFLVP